MTEKEKSILIEVYHKADIDYEKANYNRKKSYGSKFYDADYAEYRQAWGQLQSIKNVCYLLGVPYDSDKHTYAKKE